MVILSSTLSSTTIFFLLYLLMHIWTTPLNKFFPGFKLSLIRVSSSGDFIMVRMEMKQWRRKKQGCQRFIVARRGNKGVKRWEISSIKMSTNFRVLQNYPS